jgi:arylsulfatase A-like enzyme
MAVDRPDLVLIMTDQQRFDQVGYSSGGHFETPTLDSLAAQGVIFDTAYSAATVCVPARSALLTGLQPHRLPTQENGLVLREGFWTVAHELRHAGYETALFGKMHFSPVHAHHGFETMRLCEHIRHQALGPLSRERGDEVDDYHDWLLANGLPDYRIDRVKPTEAPFPFPTEAHPTVWLEREVSAFLANRDRSRPLFLVVSFLHPHAPYDPPEPYASMYDPADSVLPPAGYEVNEKLPLVFQLATDGLTRAEAADPDRVRAFQAIVRGSVKQIDDSVARLVAQLELERTVVFFTSDHGDFSGHRGLMNKIPWIAFDDLARVPFFVTGADIAGGRRVPELVSSCDLALTCLDYAGIAPPEGVEFATRSLRPILDDDPAADDLDRTVLCATTLDWPMVRRGRHKYLIHAVHRDQPVLFDLEADPLERVNVVDEPAYRTVRDELSATLYEALSESVLDIPAPTGAPLPKLTPRHGAA